MEKNNGQQQPPKPILKMVGTVESITASQSSPSQLQIVISVPNTEHQNRHESTVPPPANAQRQNILDSILPPGVFGLQLGELMPAMTAYCSIIGIRGGLLTSGISSLELTTIEALIQEGVQANDTAKCLFVRAIDEEPPIEAPMIVAAFPKATHLRFNLTDPALHLRNWLKGTTWTRTVTSVAINGRNTVLSQAIFKQCIGVLNQLPSIKVFHLAEIEYDLQNCNWTFLGRLKQFSVFGYPHNCYPMLKKLNGVMLTSLGLRLTGPMHVAEFKSWLNGMSYNDRGDLVDCTLTELTLDTTVLGTEEVFTQLPLVHLCACFKDLQELHLEGDFLRPQLVTLAELSAYLQMNDKLTTLAFNGEMILLGVPGSPPAVPVSSVLYLKVHGLGQMDEGLRLILQEVFPRATIE